MTSAEVKAIRCSVNMVWVEAEYLTIFPRARMGPESIAHEAEGRLGGIDSEAKRARGIIVLVKSN